MSAFNIWSRIELWCQTFTAAEASAQSAPNDRHKTCLLTSRPDECFSAAPASRRPLPTTAFIDMVLNGVSTMLVQRANETDGGVVWYRGETRSEELREGRGRQADGRRPTVDAGMSVLLSLTSSQCWPFVSRSTLN